MSPTYCVYLHTRIYTCRYDERLAREERMRKATKTDKDKELEAEIAHKLNKQITDEREKEREEHVSEKDELKRDLQTAQVCVYTCRCQHA